MTAAFWTPCGSRWKAASWSSTARPGPRPIPPGSSWSSRPTPVPAARQRAKGWTASARPPCAAGTRPGCPGRCWTGSTSSSKSSGSRSPASASRRPRKDTASIAERVRAARDRQLDRLLPFGMETNAQVPGRLLRGALRLDAPTTRILDYALERGVLTARGYDRVLRLAWTLADLSRHDVPDGRRRRAGAGPPPGRRGLTLSLPARSPPPAVRKEPP